MFRAAIRHEPINLNSNYRCICVIYMSIYICLLLHFNPNGAGGHIVPAFLMTVSPLNSSIGEPKFLYSSHITK